MKNKNGHHANDTAETPIDSVMEGDAEERLQSCALGTAELPLDSVMEGDAGEVLRGFPDHSIDLVFTSPPYGDNRKSTYKGPKFNEYVDWFKPIAKEIKRVLKPDGSFVLNIKERAANGERQTYVLELILEMKKQDWVWVEEYIWHKKNSYPGKWPNRFRDAWERCLHFSPSKKFRMYQDAVKVPVGEWAETRLKNLSNQDKERHESRAQSGLGRNVSNWVGRDMVYPDNVLFMPTECSNRGHSATFPKELPEWFIKLFTLEGDIVLDPFMGSGTTGIACLDNNRHYIGVDISAEYATFARDKLARHRQVDSSNDDNQADCVAETDTPDDLWVLDLSFAEIIDLSFSPNEVGKNAT